MNHKMFCSCNDCKCPTCPDVSKLLSPQHDVGKPDIFNDVGSTNGAIGINSQCCSTRMKEPFEANILPDHTDLSQEKLNMNEPYTDIFGKFAGPSNMAEKCCRYIKSVVQTIADISTYVINSVPNQDIGKERCNCKGGKVGLCLKKIAEPKQSKIDMKIKKNSCEVQTNLTVKNKDKCGCQPSNMKLEKHGNERLSNNSKCTFDKSDVDRINIKMGGSAVCFKGLDCRESNKSLTEVINDGSNSVAISAKFSIDFMCECSNVDQTSSKDRVCPVDIQELNMTGLPEVKECCPPLTDLDSYDDFKEAFENVTLTGILPSHLICDCDRVAKAMRLNTRSLKKRTSLGKSLDKVESGCHCPIEEID